MKNSWNKVVALMLAAALCVSCGWDYQRRVSAGDGCVHDVWRLGLCLCETYRNSARYNRECARMVYAGKEMGR